LLQIHQMCPNLQILCTGRTLSQSASLQELLQRMQNIKELADDMFTLRSEDDLFAAANSFPNLESLQLEGDSENIAGLPFVDFRSFTNLKSLFLKSSVVAPLRLPPRLQKLYFYAQGGGLTFVPSDQVTALCVSICTGAPNLKSLSIGLPRSSMRRPHVVLLLNRLVLLEHLSVDSGGDESANRESLEICHPNVSYVNIASVGLSPVPQWWPNKSVLYLHGEIEPMLSMLQPMRAPNVRGVHAYLHDEPSVPPPVVRLVDAICGFDRRIISLSLDTYSHNLNQDSFKSLLSLRHLSQLEIHNLPLSQENAQALVSAMPLLTCLDLNFVPRIPDASWLAFAYLRSLTLRLGASKQMNPKAPECNPGLFILQPEKLPLLTKLIFHSKSPGISGVHLFGLEHLGELELSSSNTIPFEVSISTCKSICTALMRESLLRSLQLTTLPSLMGIGFRSCQLHEDATLTISECPRLRSCESCKDRASPSAEKCRQFEQAVYQQAADTKHIRFGQ
jgi:hypothetical protein